MSEQAALSALTLQMLTWLDAHPRTYGETMEAWRTNCPRMPIWEDAVDDGLVQVSPRAGAGMNGAAVRLTEQGRSFLAGAAYRA